MSRQGGSKVMAENQLAELRKSLQADRISRHPRYPDQALYALLDKRVEEGINRRLDAGARLTGVHALRYSFTTGLNQLYFEFAPAGGVSLAPDAVLALLDGSCRVIGVVDPFDPTQPNQVLPPLPTGGLLPFVMARPSVQGKVVFGAAELSERHAASHEFFRSLSRRTPRSDLGIENGEDGGVGDGGGGYESVSSHDTTWGTEGGPTTFQTVVHLPPPDQYIWYYQTDTQADATYPDSHADQIVDDHSP